jgi:hypothetical protein
MKLKFHQNTNDILCLTTWSCVIKGFVSTIACYSNNQGFLNVSQTNSFFCIQWLNLAHYSFIIFHAFVSSTCHELVGIIWNYEQEVEWTIVHQWSLTCKKKMSAQKGYRPGDEYVGQGVAFQ